MEPPGDLRLRTPDRLVGGSRLGQQEQAGDLVLVLVGHQLVEVAGDGVGEPGRLVIDALLGPAGRGDHPAEALGIARRLVIDEVVGQPLDQLVEGFRRGVGDPAGGLLDLVGNGVPPPTPAQGCDVALHGNPVELDRPLDHGGLDRDRPGLHGNAKEEHVGGGRIAEQSAGDCCGVRVAVVVAAGDFGQSCGEQVELGVRRRRVGHHRPGRRRRRRADDDRPAGPGAGAVAVAGPDQKIECQQAVDAGGVGAVGHRRAVGGDA